MRPVNDILMHEGGGVLAGAALRYIWQRGPTWGYIGTAGLLVASIMGDQFVRGPAGRRALEGAAAGTAGIAGWIGTEKLLFGGGSAPIPARYPSAPRVLQPQMPLRAIQPGPRGGAPMPLPTPQMVEAY
jgi:hypothetical protein